MRVRKICRLCGKEAKVRPELLGHQTCINKALDAHYLEYEAWENILKRALIKQAREVKAEESV